MHRMLRFASKHPSGSREENALKRPAVQPPDHQTGMKPKGNGPGGSVVELIDLT
jgi:hypothetical protein